MVTGASASWQVYLNTGTTFEPSAQVFAAPVERLRRVNGEYTDHMLADFNGDGLPDLLHSELTNSGALRWLMSRVRLAGWLNGIGPAQFQ